jgi:hypothetical protein
MTEATLLAAYAAANDRVEACACGGVIRADPLDLVGLWRAVARHNLSEEHQRWRERQERELCQRDDAR